MSRRSELCLIAQGLTLTVAGKSLLDDVDIDVAGGEILGLIGPNGAGKTSLLQLLAGVLAPDSGQVSLNGQNTSDLSPQERARKVAYLPQQAQMHWPLTVAHAVGLGRLPHTRGYGRQSQQDRDAVAAALRQTGMVELQHRRMNTLSGGERMRALVARMLAVEADILLADEPVAGLDPYFQLDFMELFTQQAMLGHAVILVLHDLTLAARYCDRLLLLDAGRVVTSGSPEQVLSTEHLSAVYRIEAIKAEHQAQPYIVPWHRRP